MMEIGAIRFGNVGGNIPGAATTNVGANSGGGFSGDGVNVETRFAHVDFALPTAKKNRVASASSRSREQVALERDRDGPAAPGDMGTVGYTVAMGPGHRFLNSTAARSALFLDADNLYARIDLTPAKDLKTGIVRPVPAQERGR